jgi:hypothetical protein
MSSFLKVIKKEVVERENITFKDRGAGTMVDKISPQEYVKLADYYRNNDDLKGLTEYLFMFSLCCRGDNLRNLKLSEIGYMEEIDELHHTVSLLRTVWRRSKKKPIRKNGAERGIKVQKVQLVVTIDILTQDFVL